MRVEEVVRDALRLAPIPGVYASAQDVSASWIARAASTSACVIAA